MTEEEAKWELEAIQLGEKRCLEGVGWADFRSGYLQACQKRQGEKVPKDVQILLSSLEREEQAHTMSVFDLNMKIAEIGIALEKEKEKVSHQEIITGELAMRADKLDEIGTGLSEALANAIDDYQKVEERIKELETELDREMSYKEALEQAEKKIKELESILASIKADPSIGKLVVECECDHDGEFDAGQRHCRKCGEYLF